MVSPNSLFTAGTSYFNSVSIQVSDKTMTKIERSKEKAIGKTNSESLTGCHGSREMRQHQGEGEASDPQADA